MRDLVNKKFGNLQVMELSEVKQYLSGKNRQTKAYWKCICSCGKFKVVRGEHLTSGRTISCGCMARENAKRHGLTNSPEHRAWTGMRGRVNSKNPHKLRTYKDVKVCKRWDKFESFLEDMGDKPTLKHELDRIDPFGNYEPSNCRWASRNEQMLNLKSNYGEYNRYLSLKPIVDYKTYRRRVFTNGWSRERASSTSKMTNQYR